jgi:hypothetical protein
MVERGARIIADVFVIGGTGVDGFTALGQTSTSERDQPPFAVVVLVVGTGRLDPPTHRAISAFGTSSAGGNTMRLRCAAALAVFDRAVTAKRHLSPTLGKTGLATDMPHCLNVEL